MPHVYFCSSGGSRNLEWGGRLPLPSPSPPSFPFLSLSLLFPSSLQSFPSLPFPLPFPSSPLPLEVGPLNPARGYGGVL